MGWVWVSPLKYSHVRGQLLAIIHGSVLKPIQARVQKHQHSSNYLQKSWNGLHANKEREGLAHSHRLGRPLWAEAAKLPHWKKHRAENMEIFRPLTSRTDRC